MFSFGTAAAAPQQQQQQPQQFGNVQQPMFGTAQQQQQPGAGMFNSQMQQGQQPQSNGFSFAPPQHQQQQQPQGGFSFASQQQPQLSSGFNFGGATNTTSLPSIAQPMTGVPFPKETKFNDLPPEMRNSLEAIEKSIRLAQEQSASLAARPYDATSKLSLDIVTFEARVQSCENANETCRGHISAAKRVLNQYWKYGESVARMIVASRQVSPDGTAKWVPVLMPADLSLLDEMISRLESQITEIVDSASALSKQLEQLQHSNRFSVDVLSGAIRHQQELFLGLAGRVAMMEEDLDKIRQSYRIFISKYRGDTRDPFALRTTIESSNVNSATPSNNQQASTNTPATQMKPPMTNATMPSVLSFGNNNLQQQPANVNPTPSFSFSNALNNKRTSLPVSTPNRLF